MLHSTRASALLLALVIAGTAGNAEAQIPTTSKGDVAIDRMNAEKLRATMRELWAEHVLWTRDYVVAAIDDHPSTSVVAARLMKNQEDIGNSIVPWYGKEAGTKLTSLLKEHINVAVELVGAAKAKDSVKVSAADKRWHQNSKDIATFLSGANPNWQESTVEKMLNEHLSLTAQEATARLEKRWDDDVRLFDQIFDQIMHMADALTDGIVKQFPNK